MTKKDLNLFNEMKMEFTEDLVTAYELQADRLGLSPTLPLQLIDNAVEDVTRTFKRLLAIYPRQFKEVLFRYAVSSLGSVPTLAVVNEKYVFALALSSVAEEYKPKRKDLSPTPTMSKKVAA